MLFAVNFTGGRPRRPPEEGESWETREYVSRLLARQHEEQEYVQRRDGGQILLPGYSTDDGGDGDGDDEHDDGPQVSRGYLHTYTTTHPLNLLYIDGMSAGKTEVGTLDSQDYTLLNVSGVNRPIYRDGERAQSLCRLSESSWEGRIDGFLRMESGFEVILCDFAAHLRTERITRARPFIHRGVFMGMDEMEFFAYYQAVATRYWGVGRERVVLGYEDFVTAYKYDNIDLFGDRGDGKPRMQNVSWRALEPIRQDVKRLVLSGVPPEGSSFDWQAVADKIVLRYAARLRNLLSPGLATADLLHEEIQRILQPFIDFDYRNATAEVERCTRQFIPSTSTASSTTLAARVIASVSNTICYTLRSAEETTAQGEYNAARQSIEDLLGYLDWTVWKECGGCGDDEICFVPMWPAGSREDYERPGCTNASALVGRRGYWGRFWGPN
jgi:hypothetical protein